MSESKPKPVNFNSILLFVVNLLIVITGFFAKHELEKVEQSQDKLWAAIMPRHEIEVELAGIKAQQNRCDLELVEIRGRMTTLEISLARLQKP
jgi:hypothetical protein